MYRRDRDHRIGLVLMIVPVTVLVLVLVLAWVFGVIGPLATLRGSPVLTVLILGMVLLGAYFLKRSDTYPPPNYRRRGFDRFT